MPQFRTVEGDTPTERATSACEPEDLTSLLNLVQLSCPSASVLITVDVPIISFLCCGILRSYIIPVDSLEGLALEYDQSL